jgi:YbbR domain-containing protein
MSRVLESKWFYMIVSILLAVVFWSYVRTEQDVEQEITLRSVPVQITGENILENQNMTVAGLSHKTVSLRVSCPISVGRQLNNRTVSVTVDVSRCSGAQNYELTYNINYPENITPNQVQVLERNPQRISVSIEQMYTSTYEIEFVHKGSVADGYQSGTAVINPTLVTVSGPEDNVKQVNKVVAVLTQEELSSRFSGDLPLMLLDADGNTITGLDVKLSATTAYVTLPVVVVKEIPLTVNLIGGGGAAPEDADYSIEPQDTIMVSGSEEDLAGLNALNLGDVDLAQIAGSSETRTFPVQLDPRFENVSGITEAQVTITLKDLATKDFQVENIELVNTPSIYTAHSTTQVRTITLRGDQEALDAISPSQIQIVADLSNVAAEGSYPVPVRVYLNAAGNVGVVGSYSIIVNVSS